MDKFVLFFLIFTLSSTTKADNFICLAEKASGFSYNSLSKEWVPSTFTTNAKYVLSKDKSSSNMYVVNKIGDDNNEFSCKDGINAAGFIFCKTFGATAEFRMNINNLRFISGSILGYYNVTPKGNITDESSNTPFIEIGKCSKF